MDKHLRGRILIVEDDVPLARNMKLGLESEGFEVHVENSGNQALTYSAEHEADLVILDLRLPDITGYEVCRRLRQMQGPWVAPILMVTALREPVDHLRGFAYGADAYLTKPYEPDELYKTVSILLGEVPPALS